MDNDVIEDVKQEMTSGPFGHESRQGKPNKYVLLEHLLQVEHKLDALAKDGVILEKLDSIEDTLERFQDTLDAIVLNTEKIMAAQQEALAALDKINVATNEQGASLQKISDNLTALIEKAGTNVPADVLAGLNSVASNIAAQAEFSKALASKGVTDPVPVPVPPVEPTPVTP